MELITAVVLAGPLSFFARSRRLGPGLYLLAWAIVLPMQTLVVHAEDPDDINLLYPLVNAVILAGGVALNHAGARLGRRRRARAAAA